MKKIILAVLVCLFLSVALLLAAIALVGTPAGQHDGVADGTETATVTTSAGNTVAVACFYRDANQLTVATVSDNNGNSWTAAGAAGCSTSGNTCIRVFYDLSVAAGSTVFTCTFSPTPSTYEAIAVHELSGVVAFELDASNPATAGTTGTTHDPGNITTSADGAAILTFAAMDGNSDFVAGTGYTISAAPAGTRTSSQYDVDVGPAGSKATSMTTLATETGVVYAVAFSQVGCVPSKIVLSSAWPQLANEYEDQTWTEVRGEVQNAASVLCDTDTSTVTVTKGDTGAGTFCPGTTTSTAAVAGEFTFNLCWDTAEAMTLDYASAGLTGIDEQATTVLDIPAGNYLWARDNGAFNINGSGANGLLFDPTDLDIRADVELADWTPAIVTNVVSQIVSWSLYVADDGLLGGAVSTDGENYLLCESTVAPTAPTRLQIRLTVDADNGAAGWTCTFYTRTDENITSHVGWTQLGDPVPTDTAITIFDSAEQIVLYAGSGGSLYQAAIYDSIDGALLADPDLRDNDQDNGNGTWTDDAGILWTENGTVTWTDGTPVVVVPHVSHPIHPLHPTHPTRGRKRP